ncbi:sensor histidine kinase [Cohnella hashimotonis]|uniref:Histidine kinase n=1 Tax=Cohnella hashimotonis TaxID=2826895 RepID=A0ABT6TB58_9BACL|nr:histidine kinase [Cohnella hashimotonis]MDI4644055.1 histidine kinase [Cohnella hashimotonis]
MRISFPFKMFIIYSTFVSAIILGLAALFYVYISHTLKDNSYKGMEQSVGRIATQIDSLVDRMDDLSNVIFFNKDLQEMLVDTVGYENGDVNYFDRFPDQRKRIIDVLLSIVGTKNQARRVVIFNGKSNYVSWSVLPDNNFSVESDLRQVPWLKDIRAKDGNSVLLPADDQQIFREQNPVKLISFARKMVYSWGNSSPLGYVVIQQPYALLEEICAPSLVGQAEIVVADGSGTIVYPADRQGRQMAAFGSDTLVYRGVAPLSGWSVYEALPKADFMAPVYRMQRMILYAGIGLILGTSLLLLLITNRLTVPIKQLRKSLQTISLHNPGDPIRLPGANNEITLLNMAFRKTLQRLQESMNETIQSRSKEMEAHMRALQAQMDPHFLFNSLMGISAVGQEQGNDNIVEMCSRLGQMLRYIGSYDASRTSLADEFAHAANYLAMQHFRYEDRLDYEIGFDGDMASIPVPKLILQPLVENAFNHGFAGVKPPYRIRIGGAAEGDTWTVSVRDNGKGFRPGTLETLMAKIEEFERRMDSHDFENRLQIGGMALANIYIRLRNLYKNEAVFRLGSAETGGAIVTIGGKTAPERRS